MLHIRFLAVADRMRGMLRFDGSIGWLSLCGDLVAAAAAPTILNTYFTVDFSVGPVAVPCLFLAVSASTFPLLCLTYRN